MAEILIVDDEAPITRIIAHTLSAADHSIHCAHTLEQGLKTALDKKCEVVILDVVLPDGNGLERISDFMSLPSSPEVVIITGFAEQDGAQLALESGVFDYLQKPFRKNDVMLACTRALEFRLSRLKNPHVKLMQCESIIGKSAALKSCLEAVASAAACDHSILVTGETGTGKELFAKAIHQNSPRATNNFVVVDCAALKSTLLESTLFGHEKGSFTGAHSRHEGLVKLAHQGTLFLDEIGELTLEEQKKFLRLLEIKQYYPLGSKRKMQSDFRLVTATNRDLEKMVAQGDFRSDLLYRIRGQQIHLPPLRERKSDIRDLAYHHAEKICKRIPVSSKMIYPEFIEALTRFDWPGNVRELVNTLEECISGFPKDLYLQPRHLPTRIRVSIKEFETENGFLGDFAGKESLPVPEQIPGDVAGSDLPDSAPAIFGNALYNVPTMMPDAANLFDDPPQWKEYRRQAMEMAEKNYFRALFSSNRGRVKDIADLSGITQARVYDLIKKHGIGTNK